MSLKERSPPPPPGSSLLDFFGRKSGTYRSFACSTRSSATSPVLSRTEQTSSKLRSISETPHHSNTWNRGVSHRVEGFTAWKLGRVTLSPCCKPAFSAGPPGTVHTMYANSLPSMDAFPPTTRIPKPLAGNRTKRPKMSQPSLCRHYLRKLPVGPVKKYS